MCGRARCTLNQQQIGRACGIQPDSHISTTDLERFRPSYNVSPGAYLPVVVQRDGGREIQCMKWGLVPGFTKKTEKPDHYRMFNARSESINEKASFRRLLPKNRCLVAVEGFYEWKKDGSKKQPYYIHFKDQRPIVFASLYDTWTNSEGEILYTFTILTTCSSSGLQWIHDRMPVILGNNASIDEWLDPLRTSKFDSGLGPYEGSDLVWHSVTPAMGKASFDDPECIKELNPVEKNPISKFFSKKKIDQLSYGDRIENIVKEEAGISGIIKEHSSDDSFDKKCPKIFSDSEIKMDDQLFVADKDEEQVKKDKCGGRIKKKECGVKRNYDVNISSRSEHTAHFVNKTMESMSKKKKASIKTTTVGDGQSTLLSFFKKNHP